MRILILGGSGFIGTAVAKALSDRGHAVAGLARDVEAASRRLPRIDWVAADLVDLAAPGDWTVILEGIDAVVNCAGVLQDTARDDVAKVQERAMRALYEAAAPAGLHLIVQISARTGGSGSETPFLATKRRADDALKASGIPFVILRPAVVIGRNAYGGSALLRALAAFPRITPLVHASSPMQFVSMDDLVSAIAESLDSRTRPGSDLYLAADETLTLAQAVALHRRWLGLSEAPVLNVPVPFAVGTSLIADLLGWLGWRSPLRSTAMLVAQGGVTGDSETANRSLVTLSETLAANPAGVLSAYKDNASVVAGPTAPRFMRQADRRYAAQEEGIHLLMKVETHNHPTGISPHPGAATGAGGEIRDEAATGRGGKPKAGLCGFTVSNLQIPDFGQAWEQDLGRPGRMASALQIMLEGPIGAAAYNNEFGRPNLCGYFRSFEAELPDGTHVGYHKPIMIAGGMGNVRDGHVEKLAVPVGAQLVVLGGPAMLIGLGGGAASSMATGASDEALDFASVQRANPELERRCQEVVDACWALGEENPILSIHDVGAGHLIIDPKGCVDCGASIEVCPGCAIFEERRVPTEWRPFIDINAQLAREMKTT